MRIREIRHSDVDSRSNSWKDVNRGMRHVLAARWTVWNRMLGTIRLERSGLDHRRASIRCFPSFPLHIYWFDIQIEFMLRTSTCMAKFEHDLCSEREWCTSRAKICEIKLSGNCQNVKKKKKWFNKMYSDEWEKSMSASIEQLMAVAVHRSLFCGASFSIRNTWSKMILREIEMFAFSSSFIRLFEFVWACGLWAGKRVQRTSVHDAAVHVPKSRKRLKMYI